MGGVQKLSYLLFFVTGVTTTSLQASSVLNYEDQAKTKIKGIPVFVTHLTEDWPGAVHVKARADYTLSQLSTHPQFSTVYLMVSKDAPRVAVRDPNWNTKIPSGDYNAYSSTGEHSFKLRGSEAIILGGFFEACATNTMANTAHGLDNSTTGDVQIHFIGDSVFHSHNESLNEYIKNKYKGSYKDFVDIEMRNLTGNPLFAGMSFEVRHPKKGTFFVNNEGTGKRVVIHLWENIDQLKAERKEWFEKYDLESIRHPAHAAQ